MTTDNPFADPSRHIDHATRTYAERLAEERRHLREDAALEPALEKLAQRDAMMVKVRTLVSSTAVMQGWYLHPTEGWFCPYGCHITIAARDMQAIKYGQRPPEHLPTCGIMIARELREEMKREVQG